MSAEPQRRRRRVNKVTGLRIDEVSLVDNPANPHARVLLMKRADPSNPPEEPMAVDLETLAATLEEAESVNKSLTAEKEQLASDKEQLEKRLSDLAEQLEKAQAKPEPSEIEKALAAERDRREALEKSLEGLLSERKDASYLARVRKEFSHLPAEAEVLAKSLRAVDEHLPEEAREHLTRVLKSADAMAANALKILPSSPAEGTVEAKLEALVKARQTADGIGYSAAWDRVLAENPQLYSELRAEKRRDAN